VQHFLHSLQFSSLALFFLVVIVSACVLGGVFVAMRSLNRAVDQADR
jgi:uncharacterized protein YneF (UPF0154 family)